MDAVSRVLPPTPPASILVLRGLFLLTSILALGGNYDFRFKLPALVLVLRGHKEGKPVKKMRKNKREHLELLSDNVCFYHFLEGSMRP